MKKLYSLIGTILFCVHIFAQAPNWLWTRTNTGQPNTEGWSVATDNSNHAYLMGSFEGNILVFGADTLYNANHQSGGLDIYVTKFDSLGNVVWATSAGGNGDDFGYGFAADDTGNTYVTGYFGSTTIGFGPDTFINLGMRNIFIVKYDSTGHVVWAKAPTGNNFDWGAAIAPDASGNVFVTGSFSSDSITFGTTTLRSAGHSSLNIFIAKLDARGNPIWAKSTGRPRSEGDVPNALTVDKNGDVYITGTFDKGIINFDSITLVNTDTDYMHVFVVKYSSTGQALWAKQGVGNITDNAYSVATDTGGNAYITGGFGSDTITFGTTKLINPTLNGAENVFIVKFSPTGDVLWAMRSICDSGAVGFYLAIDTEGQIYLTGQLNSSSVSFFGTPIERPAIYADAMFMVKLDAEGKVLCDASMGSGADDQNAVCLDRTGNAYIAGDYYVIPFIIGTDTLPAYPGIETAFLTKFNCNRRVVNSIAQISNGAALQLYPDPFSSSATVDYILPADSYKGSQNTALVIYDMLGKRLRSYPLNNSSGEITINGNTLNSGVYLYSLVVDEQPVISKRMVVE